MRPARWCRHWPLSNGARPPGSACGRPLRVQNAVRDALPKRNGIYDTPAMQSASHETFPYFKHAKSEFLASLASKC